jgi:drug/metabolite transporter (DMT)-like permease
MQRRERFAPLALQVVVERVSPVLGGEAVEGDGLGLLAGALWGLTTVVIRASRLSATSPEKILFYQVGVAALVLPFVSWALGERWALPASTLAVTSVVLQTVVGAFGSYLLWMWLLVRYPATQISVFVFLTPVFALIFGALWLGEPVTPHLLLALALVSAGLVLVNRR